MIKLNPCLVEKQEGERQQELMKREGEEILESSARSARFQK